MEATFKTSTSLRRKRDSSSSSHPLKKRDIAFIEQTVSVVKKVGEFGTSYLYSAKDDSARRRDGKSLLIKATAAATMEQARRAEAEMRLLRRLSGAPGIPNIIDSGFSTIEEKVNDYEYDIDDDRLEARRLYCLLLEPCPDYFLSEFTRRRRRKYTTRGTIFNRMRKETTWEGYLSIDTVLDIFGQMVSAISAIHNFQDDTAPKGTKGEGRGEQITSRQGLVHLDIQPSRFFLRKLIDNGDTDQRYEVKLCSFGCSIRGGMPLTTTTDCEKAAKLIESSSSPMYRSPEMTDLSFGEELNASADVWGLGCCFYELLFLTECFKCKQHLMQGVFLLPSKHPYSSDVIELLAWMMTVNSNQRATIEEVEHCVNNLKKGESLTLRKTPLASSEDTRPRCNVVVESIRGSDQFKGEPSEESHALTPDSDHVASNSFSDDVGDKHTNEKRLDRLNASHNDGCSSDTDYPEWLEFKPGSSDGLNLEKHVAPLPLSTRIIQRGSMRRRRRVNDPLSLGAASASLGIKDDKKQNLFSDRKLGLINQLSTRSLNPIDASASDGSGEKDDGITPLATPSLRKINPYGLALKTRDSPGIGRAYGPGRFLSSAQSLRVSDLMRSKRTHGTSSASSEFGSSSTTDIYGRDFHSSTEGPQTSTEWGYSSTEIPSSSDIVSSTDLTMSTSDMSLSIAITNSSMTDSTRRRPIEEIGTPGLSNESPLRAPLSAPVRMGVFPRPMMFDRGASPNVPPMPLSQKSSTEAGMISPMQFIEGGIANDADISEQTYVGPLHASDSRIELKKKKKKSKEKKDKSKKTKKKKKKLKENFDSVGETILGMDVGHDTTKFDSVSTELKETEKSIVGSKKSIYRSTTSGIAVSSMFGNQSSFDDDDAKGQGIAREPFDEQRKNVECEIKQEFLSADNDEFDDQEFDVGTGMIEQELDVIAVEDDDADVDLKIEHDMLSFGNSKVDNWGSVSSIGFWSAPNEGHQKKSKMKRRSSKNDKSTLTALDHKPWDLEAAEKWVETISKEASALSPAPMAGTQRRRNKFQRDTFKSIHSVGSLDAKAPEDWVSDAGRWVTKEVPTKASKLREAEQEDTTRSRSADGELASTWFASKLRKEMMATMRSQSVEDEMTAPWFTPVAPQVKTIIDTAGFPLTPEVGFNRTLPENKPSSQRFERTSRSSRSNPLDKHFKTPQPTREKLEVPRSAVSMSEISVAKSRIGSSSSYQTLESIASHRFSVGSGAMITRTKSGSTQRSSRTLNSQKETSVDSNMPPGDVVVSPQVSVPLPRSHNMSVKEEVHMALTAEGRQMKRSIKRVEESSPFNLLTELLLQEKEPETQRLRRSSHSAVQDKVRVAAQSYSTGSVNIPSTVELMAGNDADDGPHPASGDDESAFVLRTLAAWSKHSIPTKSPKRPNLPKITGLSSQNMTPLLKDDLTRGSCDLAVPSDTPNRIKKLKQGKERKSERRSSKKKQGASIDASLATMQLPLSEGTSVLEP